eukprot:8024829-Pyramimonas_sp.AAC.1
MIQDMVESGELESIIMGGVTILTLLYLSWRGFSALREGSEVVGDSDSDGEVIQGMQVADSDDEPDARHLFAELPRGQ